MTENNPNVGWGTPVIPEAAVEVAPVKTYEIKYPGQPETEDPEAYRLRRNAEIDLWLKSKHSFDIAKADEKNWRAKVTKTLFPIPKKGTQRYELGGGYKVKLIHGLTYSIGDKDKVDEAGQKVPVRTQVEELEDKVAAMGDAHRVLFEGVVSWVPTVSGSAYEKLNAQDPVHLAVRSAIDEMLTISPSSPQLAFEPPKDAD